MVLVSLVKRFPDIVVWTELAICLLLLRWLQINANMQYKNAPLKQRLSLPQTSQSKWKLSYY